MMKALFFHNPHQKESRDLLFELNDPRIEVIDFMVARNTYYFRGTPAVRIGTETGVAWQKSVDLTVEEIQEAIAQARELSLVITPTEITVDTPVAVEAIAYDISGQVASLPLDVKIVVDDNTEISSGIAEITFEDPGVYRIRAMGSVSIPAEMEVVVNASI